MRGALFENWIISELLIYRYNLSKKLQSLFSAQRDLNEYGMYSDKEVKWARFLNRAIKKLQLLLVLAVESGRVLL